MKKVTPRSRKDNLVIQEMSGEILIYDLNDNRAFCLNETSMLVWQACDGEKSIAEISDYISKKLNASVTEDLIWLALDQLKKENLIANGDKLKDIFIGMSRREVIKKVGLGTMIALPIVASVTAPVAAQAATCNGPLNRVLNVACTQSCQCYNNLLNNGPSNMCCRATTVVTGMVVMITFAANRCSEGLVGGCLSV